MLQLCAHIFNIHVLVIDDSTIKIVQYSVIGYKRIVHGIIAYNCGKLQIDQFIPESILQVLRVPHEIMPHICAVHLLRPQTLFCIFVYKRFIGNINVVQL